MAKIPAKNIRIMIVYFRRGIAENNAYIRTLRPLMDEMVLRGLMTLKALSEPKLNDES